MMELTGLMANLATAAGIPLALIVFVADRLKARRDREREVYQAMQAEYVAFLRLCFEHPELGLAQDEALEAGELSPRERARRLVAMEMLVSMMESAYFLYEYGHRSRFRRRQWTGWDQYLNDWAARRDFRDAWRDHLGSQFDSGFVAYMNGLVERHHPRAAAHAAPAASVSSSAAAAGGASGGHTEGGGSGSSATG